MKDLYKKYPILIKAINFINISNGSSNHLQYHSIDHLFSVFQMCFEIVHYNKIYDYDVNYKLELYIAALFHDYAHSGGKLTDSENIINALDSVMLFHKANPEFDLNIVIQIIKATEYPYTIDENDFTLFEQKIIRDADMCYLFQPLSIVKLYSGLRSEFGTDYNTFLNNQFNFLNNVKFYTEYHNDLWENSVKELRLNELELLKQYV